MSGSSGTQAVTDTHARLFTVCDDLLHANSDVSQNLLAAVATGALTDPVAAQCLQGS
jgi:hypothetical protein